MKLVAHNTTLDLSHTHVMGILNVTPDSFFDGGVYSNITDAINHVEKMINHGATIIDIGGESTRPGSSVVTVKEELSRVIPIIKVISQNFKVWISVNTSKPEVIYESANAGVHIINDIRSLLIPGALEAAVAVDLPVCIMHMQGEPKTMQNKPQYINVVAEVDHFFSEQIARCERAGIAREKLLLDPGFGFGKNLSHNYALLAHISSFHHFDLPLLVGISRKSMIGQLLNVGIFERLSGSLACAVIAAMQGVHIVRVHDVKETVEAIRVVKATLSATGGNRYYE